MKDKNVAGILALFLGGFGVHRFYLGQTGLGIFYLLFFWFPITWIVGLIDAIAFFSMDKLVFDAKYNREFFSEYGSPKDDYRRRDAAGRRAGRREERYQRRYETRSQRSRPKAPPRPPRSNPYKASGIRKYKDYDYSGAIVDFEKALEIEPNDVATHFNLACAYSLNEKTEKAFFHLDRAVAHGFNDFQRIKTHDALAYLRIQDEFEDFEKNGFRRAALTEGSGQEMELPKLSEEAEEQLEGQTGLLEQLKRLGELREKGLLTEEEFSTQKKKLLE